MGLSFTPEYVCLFCFIGCMVREEPYTSLSWTRICLGEPKAIIIINSCMVLIGWVQRVSKSSRNHDFWSPCTNHKQINREPSQ